MQCQIMNTTGMSTTCLLSIRNHFSVPAHNIKYRLLDARARGEPTPVVASTVLKARSSKGVHGLLLIDSSVSLWASIQSSLLEDGFLRSPGSNPALTRDHPMPFLSNHCPLSTHN